MATIFTPEQKKKIQTIVNDKYSVGAFSGMIYNASVQNPDESIDKLIQKAIAVRLRLEELAK